MNQTQMAEFAPDTLQIELASPGDLLYYSKRKKHVTFFGLKLFFQIEIDIFQVLIQLKVSLTLGVFSSQLEL